MTEFTTTPDGLCGWHKDPVAVAETYATMDRPVYGLDSLGVPEHRDVLLWEEGEIPLFGRTLPAHAQKIGSCVSHGWARVVQHGMYVDMARRRPRTGNEEIKQIATEPIYALSRVEIGKGRIGRGDGSVGAWAAKAVTEYGVLLRGKYGQWDLTENDESIAKQWGMPNAGLPDDLEPVAREHPVKYAEMTDTKDKILTALYNLYGIAVCSDQGFTMQRDQNGMCKPQGSWSHCLAAVGIAMLKGKRLVVPIQQSWGDNPTGPDEVELESGRKVKLPEGVFFIDFDVFLSMCRQQDSFAAAGPEGFQPREPFKPVFW